MRAPLFVLVLSGVVPATACHRHSPSAPRTPATTSGRNVFTDSTLHAQRCEPTKSGENWRLVCVPKDQRVDVDARPKKP